MTTHSKSKTFPDPMAPPAIPLLPADRREAVRAWSDMVRTNVYLRRNIHRLQRKLARGEGPTPFMVAPRYAKLTYRPIVLGVAPTIYARSPIAWDDPNGDAIAGRFGLFGLMQLMANFKLRNILSHPLQDLPPEYQSTAAKQRALDQHVATGLFKGRVLILVGDARRVAGYDCDRDYIGPLTPALGDSTLTLSMVEPQKSGVWASELGKRAAVRMAVYAMLAARLPSADPVGDAMMLFAGADVPSWRAVGGEPGEAFIDLMRQDRREIWTALVRMGIAAPADLAAGIWHRLGEDWQEAYFANGLIRMTFDQELRAKGGDYVHGRVFNTNGGILFEATANRPHLVRTRCMDEVVRLGWEHPYAALDRQLAAMRQPPLHVDAVARAGIYREGDKARGTR